MKLSSHVSGLSRLVALGALLGVAAPATGQISQANCDVPLIIQSAGSPANVMIVLDSSGSMNSAIYHPAYDEDTDYSGNFSSTRTYYVRSNGNYEPRDFYWRWPTSPSAPLVKSDGESGRYRGNYLNWIYYHATSTQRAQLPQLTRIQVAKAAVLAMLQNVPNLRYGLTIFNYDDGGTRLSDMGDPIPDISNQVANLEANDWTPLAETMVDVTNYYKQTGAGAPIKYECQSSFTILVTDGLPTKDTNVPSWIGDQDGDGNDPGNCSGDGCTDWLDDVTYYLAHEDMRPDLDGEQNVVSYVVGFEINAPVLVDAATNGMGEFFTASNLPTLLQTLGSILGDILTRTSAGTAAAVVSAEQTTSDKLIRANFVPGLWAGMLEAYAVPYQDGDSPVWEAGELLEQRSPNDREMFSFGGSSMIDFTSGNADELSYFMGTSEAEAAKIINYVRGEDQPGMRDRDGWKLGDIVYSSPLIIGAPNDFFVDEGYQNFLANHEQRTAMAYVGSNDGQLHAFRLNDGHELWSYVPQNLLSKLRDFTDPSYCHQSYVDLSPAAFDVQINNVWKTVMVGGLRTGGDSYFALDITNPEYPEVLWETSVPQLGSSFTEPAIVRKETGTYLWVGSAPDASGTAWVSVLDLATGAQSVLPTQVGSTTGDYNAASAALAYDADYDDLSDYLYFGDLAGQIWKVDVTSESPASWRATLLFDGDQPIQSRPEVALSPDGEALVYFGTGRYVDASDLTSTDQQTFFMVKDDGENYGLTKSDLVDQTYSISDVSGASGWYFDLKEEVGERVIEPAAVAAGVVYFTSFAPTFEPCSAGGKSFLYGVNYLDGSSAADEGESGGGTTDRIVEDLGDGVASRTIVDLLNEQVIVQTSDARLTVRGLSVAPQRITVRAWREKF